MKHLTTIEIDEIDTEVLIEYRIQFGEPEILFMTDVHTGDAIAPDLLNETRTCDLLNELHEVWCDEKAERNNDRFGRLKFA